MTKSMKEENSPISGYWAIFYLKTSRDSADCTAKPFTTENVKKE